ncbi:MAG TPA: DsrE family protein [Thermoplasmata archaeon]|nr:DsrE family protein [Thermoplasmata archaeon]
MSEPPASSAPPDPTGKRILMIVTTGPEERDKTYAPFFTAALMAAMEIDTTMFFMMHAPELLKKGTAEKIPLRQGHTLRHFVDMAIENGVKLLACAESCRDLCDLGPGDLLPEVKVVGAPTMADLALDADAVLSF